jgi:hypothetical protein
MRARRVPLIVLAVAACATAGPSPTVAPVEPSSPPAVTPSAAVATAVGTAPPAARLAAEGGDPVTGQLGTYTWRDTGTDSPWLPGAAIAVGPGEPLSVSLEPAVDIDTWRARFVPANADGPEGATALGEGAGSPAFPAPVPGAWTVEVHVVFAGGLGDASYFWRLEIR